MGNGIDDMLFMPPKQEESHMLRIEDNLQQDNLQQNDLLQNNPQQYSHYDKMQDNLLQGVLQQDIKIRPEFFHPVNPEQEQYRKEQQAERQELQMQAEEKRWAEMLQKARSGESNPEFDKVGIEAVEKWLSDENKQARVEERAKQREYDALVEAQRALAWKIDVTRTMTEQEEDAKRFQPTKGVSRIDGMLEDYHKANPQYKQDEAKTLEKFRKGTAQDRSAGKAAQQTMERDMMIDQQLYGASKFTVQNIKDYRKNVDKREEEKYKPELIPELMTDDEKERRAFKYTMMEERVAKQRRNEVATKEIDARIKEAEYIAGLSGDKRAERIKAREERQEGAEKAKAVEELRSRMQQEEEEELEADRQKVLTPEQQQKADQLKAETAERLRQLKAIKQDKSELFSKIIENRNVTEVLKDKSAYDEEIQELVQQRLEQDKAEAKELARQAKKRYTPEVTEEKTKLEKLLEETQKKYENINKGLEQAKSLLSIHAVQVASGDINSEENEQKKKHYEAAIEKLSGEASQHEKAIDEYQQKIDTLPYYIEGEQQPEQEAKKQPEQVKEQPGQVKEQPGQVKEQPKKLSVAEMTEEKEKLEKLLEEKQTKSEKNDKELKRVEGNLEAFTRLLERFKDNQEYEKHKEHYEKRVKMCNHNVKHYNMVIDEYKQKIDALQQSIDGVQQAEQEAEKRAKQKPEQAEKQPQQILSPEAKLQADIAKLQALYAEEAGRMQTEKESAAGYQAEIERLLNKKKQPGLTQKKLDSIEGELNSARYGLQIAEENQQYLQKAMDGYQLQLDKLQPKEQVKQVEAVVVEKQAEQVKPVEAVVIEKQVERVKPVEAVVIEKQAEQEVEKPVEAVVVEKPAEQEVEKPVEAVVVEKQPEQVEKQPEQAVLLGVSKQELEKLQKLHADKQRRLDYANKLVAEKEKMLNDASSVKSETKSDEAYRTKIVNDAKQKLEKAKESASQHEKELAEYQKAIDALTEQPVKGVEPVQVEQVEAVAVEKQDEKQVEKQVEDVAVKEQVKQVEAVVVEKQPEQVLSPEAKLEADIANLKKWQDQTLVRLELLAEENERAQRIAESLRDDLVQKKDEKTGRKRTAKELDKIEKRLQDIEDRYESREVARQAQQGHMINYQEKLDKLQQQLDALRKPAEQQPKEQVKQVEDVAVKEQVKQVEDVAVKEQVKQEVEQPKEQVKQEVKQVAISIQEQGLQNVNAVQKLVQNEVNLLTNEQKKIGLAQIISVNPADDAGVQKLVEQGLIQNPFLFHVLRTAFDDIDTLAADQMDLKSLGEQFYDGLSPDMYHYVDEYVAMKETKLAQPVNQEGPLDQVNQAAWLLRDINKDEAAVEKTDEMSDRELSKLTKSKLELRKLVDINTDYLSVQALPLAKVYLGASKKFSSAVAAKIMDNDTLVPEAEETWATLEHRYYGLAAQKRIEDMASAKVQRQKEYKQTTEAQRKMASAKNEQLFQETKSYQEWNFGDIAEYVQPDVEDVLWNIHDNKAEENTVGLDQVGDQDVLADIEAGTFEFDQANASKTREVKVTQGLADAFGDIEAIEKTEETGLAEKEAVQLDSSQATLSPAYVQAAMRLDSWLQGDDGKNLMSEVPETRQAVLNKLVTKAFKYNLDSRMFGEKSFEKNGEKIIEMALFIPGLLELVNQEGKRSGYNASGKQPVLDAMGEAAQTLYEGYSQYAQLHGLQLGDITRSQVKIDNVYEAKKAANSDADLLKSAEEAHVFAETESYVNPDTLRDLAEVAIEHTQKSTQQHSVDAQTNVKVVATRVEYDHCLASMSEKEQRYRQQKEDGTLEVVRQKRETVPEKQVEQAQQKVQEHMEGIQQRGGLQQEQSVNVYSQVEQQVRQEINQAPQQPEQMLENRLDMATFDKKATAPLSAKELKEQERQRKKAIKRTGTGMGVTHRTGVLLESIEKSKLREITPSNAGARKYDYSEERSRAKKDLRHAKYSNRARWLEQEANEAQSRGVSAWTVGITRMQSRWNGFLASKNIADITHAEVPGQMQLPVRRQLGGFDEIKDWTSAKQRNRLARLSPDQAGDKAAAQEVLSDAINTATSSLKLNAASFSASFFTANAQKIMEKISGFRRLESLTNMYGLRDTRPGQKIRSYMQKFEALYDGFECFVANNGLSLSGESSFADQGYANMDEYRKAYKTQVTKNTNDLQRHYNAYCKALQGNA